MSPARPVFQAPMHSVNSPAPAAPATLAPGSCACFAAAAAAAACRSQCAVCAAARHGRANSILPTNMEEARADLVNAQKKAHQETEAKRMVSTRTHAPSRRPATQQFRRAV